MAGEKVQSGNLRLMLDNKKIFDATGCSISMARETKQRAATKDTSAGASTKSTKTWSAGYDGLAVYASDGADAHDFKALVDLWNDDTDTLIEVEFVPNEADYVHYYKGEGILTALDGTFNVDEDGTISLTITGSSDLLPVDKSTTAPST
ncbi:MAG: hypothetical protein AAF039_16000 [Bacteroidota bacterium]